MTTLYLLLAFPLFWPFIAKLIWKTEIKGIELAANIVIVTLLTGSMWAMGVSSQTSDTEILSGQVTQKHRDQGTYEESYSCHCHTVYSGSGKNRTSSEVCSTCYRTHYTVKWWLSTTINDISIDNEDSTSRSVYNTPDPKGYVSAYVGEPCSTEHGYDNYVKAVPDSLFNKLASTQFDALVPEYPRVSGYHVNRVLDVKSQLSPQKLADLDKGLSEINKTLGAARQANIVLIVTGIDDPYFKYAVEHKWVGGKKNDVILILGVKGDNIIWTDVMTFGLNKGNELFQVLLRDELKNIGTVDVSKIVSVTDNQIMASFKRTEMKKFEYLKDSIEPPMWGIITMMLLSIISSIGLSIFFARNDF